MHLISAPLNLLISLTSKASPLPHLPDLESLLGWRNVEPQGIRIVCDKS